MTKAPELKPCPFCGTIPVEISLGFLGDRRVQHQGGNGCDCPIDGHICLLGNWNTRADLAPEAFQQMREALEPFSKFAGETFAKNFNNDDVITAMSGYDGVVKLRASDFFKARAALKAAEGAEPHVPLAAVAAAYEDAAIEADLTADNGLGDEIRSHIPADATAAYEAALKRARNEALEEAAELLCGFPFKGRETSIAAAHIRAMKEPEE